MVTTQTAEIGEAEMTLTELRRTAQSLEINLDSMRNLVRALIPLLQVLLALTSVGLTSNPVLAQILPLPS